MSQLIKWPHGPIIDPRTGNLTLEWVMFLQTPDFISVSFANALGVDSGGTGRATLTAHGVLIGEGTSPVNITPAGDAYSVLQATGTTSDPAFSAPSLMPHFLMMGG